MDTQPLYFYDFDPSDGILLRASVKWSREARALTAKQEELGEMFERIHDLAEARHWEGKQTTEEADLRARAADMRDEIADAIAQQNYEADKLVKRLNAHHGIVPDAPQRRSLSVPAASGIPEDDPAIEQGRREAEEAMRRSEQEIAEQHAAQLALVDERNRAAMRGEG